MGENQGEWEYGVKGFDAKRRGNSTMLSFGVVTPIERGSRVVHDP